MKKLILAFVLIFPFGLHAQWLVRPGYMNSLYIDPNLMKANKVKEFRIVSDVHEGKLYDRDFKISWLNKDDYWVNENGFVFAGGMRNGIDTLVFYHFAPLANNPNIWTMVDDSMRFNVNSITLVDTFGHSTDYTTFDTLGRLIRYRSMDKKEKRYAPNMRFEYNYVNNRLDHMSSKGTFNRSGSHFIYNDDGQLARVIILTPQYYYEPDSNCYTIDGFAEYTYDKRGLLKSVKETYDFDKTYWTISRFKWRVKK